MDHRAPKHWSVSRSLALLAAIFAIVVGATLPTAIAASPVTGHPVQLCSGSRIFVDDAGQPVRPDPGPDDSLKCAACLAGGFVALTPQPPVGSPAAVHCPGEDAHPVPVRTGAASGVRPAPRPPSTAPPAA